MKRIMQLLLALLPIGVFAANVQSVIDCGREFQVKAVEHEGFRFVRWSDGNTDNPRTVTATQDMTFAALFERIEEPQPDTTFIHDGDETNLGDITTGDETDVVVEPGGSLNIDEDNIRIHSLAIVVNGWSSGQLHNPDKRVFHVDDIYIDFHLVPGSGEASSDLWYAFSVPFKVNINKGIKNKNGGAPVYGKDFIIMEYDGKMRADTGKGWKQLNGNMLHPGRFYLFGINGSCNNWYFHKEDGEDIFSPGEIATEYYAAGNTDDSGWNGIGNPTLEYTSAAMSGISYICLYDNKRNDYTVMEIDEVTLAVGQPFFIQTGTAGFMDFEYHAPAHMRSRAAKERHPRLRLSLAKESEAMNEAHMFVSLHEDGLYGQYKIGRDVGRMDNNARLPHIWCEAYDLQLAAHGIPLPEDETVVSIGLAAPQNGTYHLTMDAREMEEFDIELLRLGITVALLNHGQPLPLELKAGTTNDYALRIRRKSPTSLGDVQSDKVQCTKVLRDGQMYILRNGRVYDALGKRVF